MGSVKESNHSPGKWSRVCLKFAGLFSGSILQVFIQSLALKRWASGLSPGRPLKIGGNIFTLGKGGAGPPGPGAGNSSCCSLHGSYHLCQQGCSSRWGPWWTCGPARPMGSSGGGAGPPAGLPPLPPGGTGAAISNAQCNNKLNLTLLVIN